MEGIAVFGPERFSLRPNQERVFRWLGCDGDIPCRQAFERAWGAATAALAECAQPQAATSRGEDGAITVFLTLGHGPEQRMAALFRRDEYVAGSLLNTLSDEMLFQMDQQAASLVSGMLRAEHVYAHSRLEPGVGLAADAQRERLLPIQGALPFARISGTGILYPTKSMMYVITVSEQPCQLDMLHDCATCGQINCIYRDSPPKSGE